MATTPAALLRTAHASGLHAVGRELAELHRAMLRSAGDETRAVRLSVLTLVAACRDEAGADSAAEAVEQIAADHPARAIIVVARPEDPAGITADLSLQCSMARGAEQVCAEVVRLRVGGEPALHLGSVLIPLLLPDVPVLLWLVGATPYRQALLPETVEVCDQIVLDSDAYDDAAPTLTAIAEALSRHRSATVSDLAWIRTTPWREQLARAFDRSELRPFLGEVAEAEVESAGLPAGPVASALLAAGWLRSRLSARLGTLTLRSQGHDGGGLHAIRLRCRRGTDHATVEVRRDGNALITTAELGDQRIALSRAAARADATADLLVALLDGPGLDPLYVDALHSRAGAARAES